MTETADAGWIGWDGAEYPPVKPAQWVWVRHRDGEESDRPYMARIWVDLHHRPFDRWARYGDDRSRDIVAYKVYDGPIGEDW